MAIFWKKKQTLDDQSLKEAYFTASQWQLIRSRYRSNRTARFAGWILPLLILAGFFSEFLSPYPPTMAGRDKKYENGPPKFLSSGMKTDFPSGPLFTVQNANAQSKLISDGLLLKTGRIGDIFSLLWKDGSTGLLT